VSVVRSVRADEAAACEALFMRAFVSYLASVGRRPTPDIYARLPAFIADGRVFGCEVDGALAAVAVTAPHADGWEISWLAVDPARQGAGLGARLVAAVEARARAARVPALRLQTIAARTDLLRFYGRLGFVEVDRAAPAHRRDHHPRAHLRKDLALAVPAPAAVLFDLDGTLVDSERLAAPACVTALGELGFTIDVATFAERFTGLTDDAIVRRLAHEQGVTVDVDAAVRTIEAHALARFAAELETVAGAEALVDAVRVPRAVASNSGPHRIRVCLERVGLLDAFAPHLYSAAEVDRGKPAPDLFLHAARALGVAPRDCVVVEDSAHGVAAAVAAGMTAIGFAGSRTDVAAHGRALAAAGARHVAATLDDVRTLVAEGTSGSR
jgi:HAD superfamily hydrolase (TIGR01509 family)